VTPAGLVAIPGTYYLTTPAYFAAASSSLANNSTAASTGTAGSNAVMTLVGDYLYAIPEQHSLGIVHVADSTNPTQVAWTPPGLAGYDLETIFAIQDKLLLGSKEGVYVYSISDPAQPTQVGQFTHGTACDPVIANSSYAYVTLHSGTECGGAANELDILDAKDISNATMIKSYPMTSPTGLCLDGTLLFVCDQSVVKVFDASKPDYLQLLSTASVNQPSDVIAMNHVMMVVGTDGLYQFDYSDPGHLTALSTLPINYTK
jgi:hypothetical protein